MSQWRTSATKTSTLVVCLILILLTTMCISKLTIPTSYTKGDESQIKNITHSFGVFTRELSCEENKRSFDLTREDSLLVFLHIQKTGGTIFGKHLLRDMKGFSCPCTLRNRHKVRHCQCYHPGSHQLWYFSRYTRGWICGVHPDYTTLQHCLPKLLESREEDQKQITLTDRHAIRPTYLYVTLIRNPIGRYLSEYSEPRKDNLLPFYDSYQNNQWTYVNGTVELSRHTSLGARWPVREAQCKNGKFDLDAKSFRQQGTSRCFPNGATNWTGVTLNEFMECEFNPASNRMTKMLADLTHIKCNSNLINDKEVADNLMLKSAKLNLQRFAYFGLTEFQRESQALFEKTFGIEFSKEFEQQETNASKIKVTPETVKRIQEINSLDIELYRWAKELFLSRVRYT